MNHAGWQQSMAALRLSTVNEWALHRGQTYWRAALFGIVVLIARSGSGQPLDPVMLHCVSVDASGSVTLNWTGPPDPSGIFQNYQVFAASDMNGPYGLIGTVGVLGVGTWMDPVSDGTTGPLFYYVTTTTNGAPPMVSEPSDTIATIHLQVFQSVPLGSANLVWTTPAVATTADDTFSVWMEYPVGAHQIVAEVTASTYSYQHVVSVCDDSLTFHIQRSDDSGCTSSSNWTGDRFQDVTPPTPPVITSVTVDTVSGLASIDWEPSPEMDTGGYIIVYSAPVGPAIIDTVFGRLNTLYEWVESLAGIGFESYTVAAFDTCRTGVPPSPNTSVTTPFHTTMFLDHSYDQCGTTVTLEWSPYVGWPVAEHTVFVQVNGGVWVEAGIVGGSINTFNMEVEPFMTYCFAIRASEGPGLASSMSSRTCLVTDYPFTPAFNYLRTVTVSAPDAVLIIDSVDVSAMVNGYRLERSENGGEFQTIALLPPTLSPVITYTDTEVTPASTSYRYRMVVLDGCGTDAVVSNMAEIIMLRATADLNGYDRLEWNGYTDWAGQVVAYEIHRQVADGPFTLHAVAPPAPWFYMDDVSSMTASTGRFCYYVVAREAGNPSGINMTSVSNIACAVQEELVYIPNAFIVGGRNNTFKPELAYTDVSEYELSIINRWGQVIWTTHDPFQPWDGTVGGKAVPLGVYAYYCNFKNGAGRVFEKRGTVTMLTAVE